LDDGTSPGLPWSGYRCASERLNLAGEVLERQIERGLGGRPAFVHEGGILTYGALQHQVHALAAGLGKLGVEMGHRVLIRMANSPEFAVSFLAVVKIGALPVLVNSLLGTGELGAIFDQTQPEWIITEASRAAAVRELCGVKSFRGVICAFGAARDEISFESLLGECTDHVGTANTGANDPAFIVCTSGTTGNPKGIVHAHRWIIALGDLNRYRLPPVDNDVVLATGEWSFISALGHNFLFPLRNGVTGAILSGRVTPENVLSAIEKYRVTILHSVATVYRRFLALPAFEKQ
jgi:2-aminobenzoate-CoA ligase